MNAPADLEWRTLYREGLSRQFSSGKPKIHMSTSKSVRSVEDWCFWGATGGYPRNIDPRRMTAMEALDTLSGSGTFAPTHTRKPNDDDAAALPDHCHEEPER
uniref:hypothetical protein n=1 Tax=Methylobacterium sp. B34 TaxID=95563 RepID=UPI000FE149C1|nr:hypothetical protein [Methylobacterium sp. B34]